MNKPEGNDFFSVDHWNHNTDIIDSALAPTFEDYESGATVPETTTALSAIRSKTKIADLFKNIKAFCKGCCTLGMLVNNCVTDNANLPLSAAQGKMLMDQINSLNGDINELNNKQLKYDNKRYENIVNDTDRSYILIEELPNNDRNYLFATISYFGIPDVVFNVGGQGQRFYFIMPPKSTINRIYVDFYYLG